MNSKLLSILAPEELSSLGPITEPIYIVVYIIEDLEILPICVLIQFKLDFVTR